MKFRWPLVWRHQYDRVVRVNLSLVGEVARFRDEAARLERQRDAAIRKADFAARGLS